MQQLTGKEDLFAKEIPGIKIVDLTAEHQAAALAVFQASGWRGLDLVSVRSEMKACLAGDIPGYVRPRFILACHGEAVIGAAAWSPSMCSFSMYELSWATVLPQWRRRGVNALLLQERLRQIRALHGPTPFQVLVCTWPNPLYARAGFQALFPYKSAETTQNPKYIMLSQQEAETYIK